jgi:hypothetical protein
MKLNKQIVWLILGYILAIVCLVLDIYANVLKIPNNPFPVFWADSGRMFEAFQIYSPLINGKFFGLPWMDPTRPLFEGLILLIPGIQIGLYRAWPIFLFFLGSFFLSYIIIKKALLVSSIQINNQNKAFIWLLILWGLIFFRQDPTNYHVLPGIIPVIWFFDRKKPLRITILILIGSIWEGLCRVNWFFMPAVTAIIIYILQEPFSWKYFWKYIRLPGLWFLISGLGSIIIYYCYLSIAGYPSTFLNSEMKYWYFRSKLFPNSGFSLGLIPGILIISFPILFVIFYLLLKRWKSIRVERYCAIIVILGIFFIGSTFISMRAGGGYDLHNYDTFSVLFFIVFCFLSLGATIPDNLKINHDLIINHKWSALILLIVPLWFLYIRVPPSFSYPDENYNEGINKINFYVNKLETDPRPILFIENRQLIVFGFVSSENQFIRYDKNNLMEMAMANNHSYLSQFLSDVESNEFSMIVTDILYQGKKSPSDDPYWYENNVWASYVAYPIQTYYRQAYQNIDLKFEVYISNDVNLEVNAPIK